MSSRSKEKEIKKIAAGSGYKLLRDRAAKDMKRKAKNSRRDSPDDEDDSPEGDDTSESIFKEYATRLKELKKSGIKGESYDIAVLEALQVLILDLIPIAEENYRKFPIHTAASAVNGYMNQSREILVDIRALEDFQDRATRITDIIDDSYQNIAKVLIDTTKRLQSDVAEKGSKDTSEVFKDFMRSFGKELKRAQAKSTERVMQLMVTSDPKK